MKKHIRQTIKLVLQSLILPLVYRIHSKKPIDPQLILFADTHSDTAPFSMQELIKEAKRRGYRVETFFLDYQSVGMGTIAKSMMSFMKAYAQARCVFISDYYLPSASCNKRPETDLVQLWHACGAIKKAGYITKDDLKGSKVPYSKNYTLVPVSSEFWVPHFAEIFDVPSDMVLPLGPSRADRYFEEDYTQRCQDNLFTQYPQAREKKIALWAPTFRGAARNPRGFDEATPKLLHDALNQGGDEWELIVKLHPHVQKKYSGSTCDIPVHELLPVTDLLITDYSSLPFEYALFDKPCFFYAPDYEEYQAQRGLLVDIKEDLPFVVETQAESLHSSIPKALSSFEVSMQREIVQKYMSACDGKATKRIFDYLGLEDVAS